MGHQGCPLGWNALKQGLARAPKRKSCHAKLLLLVCTAGSELISDSVNCSNVAFYKFHPRQV